MISIQQHKLKPLLHFIHASPAYEHTYFHHSLPANDVPLSGWSYEHIYSFPNIHILYILLLYTLQVTSRLKTWSFSAHSGTLTHILTRIFTFYFYD